MPENLRILFIAYTYSGGGGSEAVLTTLVNHLPKNWKIDIFETIHAYVKEEPIDANINLLPPLVFYRNSKYFDWLLHNTSFYHPQIIKSLRELYEYDVVVGWLHKGPTFMLKAFPESKTIAWAHQMIDDINVNSSPYDVSFYYQKRIFCLQKNAFDCADKIINVSKKAVDSILRIYPEFSEKTKTLYNGIDFNKIVEYISYLYYFDLTSH